MSNLSEAQVINLSDSPELFDIEEALVNIYGNGLHDAEAGSVIEDGLHIFRVANWTLETDSMGFTYYKEHKYCLDAHQYIEARTGYFVNYV